MTRLEELALISRMSKALDGLHDANLNSKNIRLVTYIGANVFAPFSELSALDAAALRAQLARRSALAKGREAA
jgi:hypothetical protein